MKILKKYTLLSLVCASGLLITGCELNFENPNEYQEDEIGNPNSFAVGMYQAYQKIPANEYLITELRSDNMVSKSGDGDLGLIESYNIEPDFGEGANYWSNNYSVILNANLILDQEDEISSDTDGQQAIAEAYFMRALCHFNLVRAFKNVPYIYTAIQSTDDLKLFPQIEEQIMYNYIINDFNSSISYFEALGDDGSNKNKANLGAAYGLLAKVYMQQPSPDYGAAEAIIAANLLPDDATTNTNSTFGYTLLDEYSEIFQDNELNDEILFAVSYLGEGGDQAITADIDFDSQVQLDAQEWSFQMSENGRARGMIYTEDFKDLMFYNADEPVRGSVAEESSAVYTFVSSESEYYDAKFRDGSDDTSEVDFIVLRYADVLLLYAEAVMAGATSTVDSDAIEAFNLVRARAGATELATDGTESLTSDALLEERRKELSFENHRLYDILRFGKKSLLVDFATSLGYTFTLLTDEYLPIPQREIDLLGVDENGDDYYSQNDGY